MTSKHTPGPWNCGRSRPTRVYSDGCLVATIPEDDTPFEASWPERRERCESDARLIAAAPDLLEALKAVMEALIADLPQAEGGPTVQGALAAIAKAEGRA